MVSLYKTGATNRKPEGYSTLNPLSASNQEKKKSMLQIQKIFNKNLREKEMYKLKMNTFLAV